jgi:hypothetical protein
MLKLRKPRRRNLLKARAASDFSMESTYVEE